MLIQGTPIFFATEILLGLKTVVRNRVHDLESFEWVILFAVYEHYIESAGKDSKAGKERVPMLMKEFQNLFTALDPPALANNHTVLLGWPRDPSADYFQKIRQLLSFVEVVVGSQDLAGVLMDVWQDLTRRFIVLSSRSKDPPIRRKSFFQKEQQRVQSEAVKCMEHRDLIECLGSLIPQS